MWSFLLDLGSSPSLLTARGRTGAVDPANSSPPSQIPWSLRSLLRGSAVGCDGRARIPSSLYAPLTLICRERRREGPDPVVSTVVAASLPPPLLHAWPVHRTLPSPSSPGEDGGGKVGLPALDVVLAFPQAMTASQFPPTELYTVHTEFRVEKIFVSYLDV
uniref:Uncharacterized protein n=1 Tax=Oryza nivara TaxID=4536 RepID=A0A0E0HYQ1_ORYNI